MTEKEGFIVEAALHYGATPDDNCENYTFTEAQLLAFAHALLLVKS